MTQYLGEVVVKIEDTPYATYQPLDWIMEYISCYSQIDGAHHKQWLIDQIARIRLGTPVVVKLATWSNGQKEYRFDLGEPSKEYNDFVIDMKGQWDEDSECFEYGYDEGIPP